MYNYKSLNDISYNEISECLNQAFSDYYFKIKLNEKELETYFKINDVNKKLSYGAFFNGKMIGFIINSCNMYDGQNIVFNIATAIVPKHRGNKIFSNLFKFAEQELKEYRVEKYYLEVLQQNDRAIQSYKKQGFTIKREFSILNSSNCLKETIDRNIKYAEFNIFDFDKVSHFNRVNPSYQNSDEILMKNKDYYRVIYIQKNNEVKAFCIISKKDGQIIQLGYTEIDELKIIIKNLVSKYDSITIKNIDLIYSNILKMLYSIGFKEITKQFEMVKILN